MTRPCSPDENPDQNECACGSVVDLHEMIDPWGRSWGWQCDSCAEQAWERHCTDYDAPSPKERLELDHRAKREAR